MSPGFIASFDGNEEQVKNLKPDFASLAGYPAASP
jgi:hypothetical protein